MTLVQLEHVQAAHREGSFSKAARACGISQAALSNSVAKLEDELGERIFARTTRNVRLSPFGATLMPAIAQMLQGRDLVVASASALATPATMVVGYSPLIPAGLLNDVLAIVRTAHPTTAIRLVEENLTDVMQRLLEHTIDIALVPASTYAKDVRSVVVGQEPLFYVPQRGRTAPASAVAFRTVARDCFVMVPDRCGLARHTRALFADAGLTPSFYAGEALGYHVLEEWAALGLGSAILPQSRVSRSGGAVPLLDDDGAPVELSYRMVWHRGYHRGKDLAQLLRKLVKPAAPTRPR